MAWPSTARARSGRRWSAGSPASRRRRRRRSSTSPTASWARFNYAPARGHALSRVAGRREVPAAGDAGRQRRSGDGAGRRQPVLVVRDDARSCGPASPALAGGLHRRALRDSRRQRRPDPCAGRRHVSQRRRCCASRGRPDTTLGRAVRRPGVVPLGRRAVDRRRTRAGVRTEIRTLLENPDGSLWAGTSTTGRRPGASGLAGRRQGCARPRVHRRAVRAPSTACTAAASGRRASTASCSSARGAAVDRRSTSRRFDEASGRFVRDPTLSALPSDRLRPAFGLAQGDDGRIFANFGRGTAILTRAADGTWSTDMDAVQPVRPGADGLRGHRPERGGVVRLAADVRALRHRAQCGRARTPFSALVRRVTAGQDRRAVRRCRDSGRRPAARRRPRRLRFEFAAPTFFDETATEYQTRLDGLDADWSAWSRETRRDFTNLGLRRLPLPRPGAQRRRRR